MIVSSLPHPGGGNMANTFAAHLSQHLWEKRLASPEVDLWDGCSPCCKEGDYLQFFNCLDHFSERSGISGSKNRKHGAGDKV